MMPCLADGYFVAPHTVTDYLARLDQPHAAPRHPAFAETETAVDRRLARLLEIKGTTPASQYEAAPEGALDSGDRAHESRLRARRALPPPQPARRNAPAVAGSARHRLAVSI